MSKQDATAVDEGTRSATRFIEQLADGQCAADFSAAVHKLGLSLQAETRTGRQKATASVTLTLKFTAEASVVAVGYEINAKPPKPSNSGSVFWLTKGGNFSNENPRQTAFPGIREVPKGNPEVRDLDAANDNGDPRSV